jgi:hypothetical protein
MGHEPAGAARERKYQRPAHSHAVARAKQSQHEHPEQIHILHRRLRAEPPSGEKKKSIWISNLDRLFRLG